MKPLLCGLVVATLAGCAGVFSGDGAFVERWLGAYAGELSVENADGEAETRGFLEIRPEEGHLRVRCTGVGEVAAEAGFLVAFYRLRAENGLSGTYQGRDGRVEYNLQREGKSVDGEIVVYGGGAQKPSLRLVLKGFKP